MSLFDDFFHPAPQSATGNPVLRDPAMVEHHGSVVVLGTSPPRMGFHRRTSSGTTHISNHHRRPSMAPGMAQIDEIVVSVDYPSPRIETQDTNEQNSPPHVETQIQPCHTPDSVLPRSPSSETAVQRKGLPSPTGERSDVPYRGMSRDSEMTYVDSKQTNYLATFASILGNRSRISEDDNATVRTTPATWTSSRKSSYCSTCDGYDVEKNKDKRSEHTIISGIDTVDLLKKRDFLIKLSRAFAMYGAPSHRLEFHLRTVSEALDVESNFIVLPGLILISFGNEDHSSTTHLVKAPQGFNMSKLSAVNALCHVLEKGEILIDDGLKRLQDIRSEAEYSRPLFLSTFPVVSFGISIIGFGTNWVEAGVSALFGLVVGCLCLAAARYPSFTYLLDFAAALVVSFLARVFKSISGDDCFHETLVTLSALAVLLPGLSLTISIIEISTRNMVSGTVRMFHALFTAMLLGFGMSVGPLLFGQQANTSQPAYCGTNDPVFPYWYFLLFPPMSICICIFFEARPRQWTIMTFVSALGFVAYYFLNQIPSLRANGQLPMVLSALVIGLSSNIYARITHDAAVAPILAGILLLVPGSVGVRSTLGFLGANASDGTNFAFQMLIIGMR
ncbi:hypothetical protein SpCBS45565_g04858 [Spizellomyces sp. 'palustris']|nr:hypothetical protein SpCBS45565_g04858 [Spizellomyces sp. 'palustris']